MNFRCKDKEKKNKAVYSSSSLLAGVRDWDLLVRQAIASSEVSGSTFTTGELLFGYCPLSRWYWVPVKCWP